MKIYYRKIHMVDESNDGELWPWMDFYFEKEGRLFIYASCPLWTFDKCLSHLWRKDQ